MKRIFFSFFILFLFFGKPVVAKIKVQATIDYVTMTLEDEAQILVSIEGGSASEPVVPSVPGLDIVPSGKQSQFAFVNGSMSYNYTYRFTVIPSDKGDYKIPGFVVYSDGQEYTSNALSLVVTAENYAQQPPQYLKPQTNLPNSKQNQAPNSLDQKAQNQIDQKMANDPDKAAPFWLATNVSKINPFVSEQILYQFKFFSRVNVNLDEVRLPEFQDFYAEVVIPEQKGRENIDGQTYTTYEIVYALSPLKAGALHIEEAQLGITYRDESKKGNSGNWDPFGQMGKLNKKNLRAPAIDLEVRELPQPIPNDFANLAGQFRMESDFNQKTVALGESAKLTINILGLGNLKEAELPDWDLTDFKIYKDKPLLNTQVTPDGIQGTKTFQLALVPTKSGDLTLPELSISYFDTQSESYKQLYVPSQTLHVQDNGQSQTSNGVFATNHNPVVQNAPTDLKNIFGLYDDVDAAASWQVKTLPDSIFYLVTCGLPGFILLLPVLKKFRLPSNGRSKQKQKIKQEIRVAERLLAGANVSSQTVYLQIKVLLTQILGVNVTTKTANEIQMEIRNRQTSMPKQDELFRWLNRLEQQNYSAQSPLLTPAEAKELLVLLQELSQ